LHSSSDVQEAVSGTIVTGYILGLVTVALFAVVHLPPKGRFLFGSGLDDPHLGLLEAVLGHSGPTNSDFIRKEKKVHWGDIWRKGWVVNHLDALSCQGLREGGVV
jgi:hypothetical protein